MSALITIARGNGSRIIEPRRTLARSDIEWRALWAAHAGPDAALPAVDFGSRMVAAVFAGERPSAGHEIDILDSRVDGARLRLVVKERRPEPGMVAAQVIVTPFHIVSCPRYDGEVAFVDGSRGAGERGSSAEAAVPGRLTSGSALSASSTGLDPRVAAALAYLAGPLSGILILLAERSSRYVRFHAWQSLFALGGLWAIGFAFYVLAFLMLFVWASGFRLMLWFAFGAWGLCVLVWLLCLVKAFSGHMWRLPLAGHYAARRG